MSKPRNIEGCMGQEQLIVWNNVHSLWDYCNKLIHGDLAAANVEIRKEKIKNQVLEKLDSMLVGYSGLHL